LRNRQSGLHQGTAAWFRGDYKVMLTDGTELTLTRTHREKLESRLLLGAR
jgi:hypothetical protein